MRQPRPLLALVHAEALETGEEPVREEPGFTGLVVENEHADASRLAIAAGREDDLADPASGVGEGGSDRGKLRGRARAEERERGVEVLAGNDPS